MPRSFSTSLRPNAPLITTSLTAENCWNFSAALQFAEEQTSGEFYRHEKSFHLHLNPKLRISEDDLKEIVNQIGSEHAEDPETRSIWLKLKSPLSVARKNSPYGIEQITELQMKGIVFDSRIKPKIYGGAGWPREMHIASRDAVLGAYAIAKEGAIGRCTLRESINEYLMSEACWLLLEESEARTPFAVGWGKYELLEDPTRSFGFVLLGLPNLQPGREAIYLREAERAKATGNRTPFLNLIRIRAQAMHAINAHGALAPGRHFGNFSLDFSGNSFMHDLGPPHCLIREHHYSDEQFAAEAFAQLAYSVTPRKFCVPVPAEDHPARQLLMDNLDEVLAITLSEYYADKEAERFRLEDIEVAFFEAFTTPIQNAKAPFSQYHLKKVKSWLANGPLVHCRPEWVAKYATQCFGPNK